ARRAEQGPAVERPAVARQHDGVAPSEVQPTQQLLQRRQQGVDPDIRVFRRHHGAKRQVWRELGGKRQAHGFGPVSALALLWSRASRKSRSEPLCSWLIRGDFGLKVRPASARRVMTKALVLHLLAAVS